MKDLNDIVEKIDHKARELYQDLTSTEYINHNKVLQAFQEARISSHHLNGSTGYGYDDDGREALEKVYARIFGAEEALVRGQIVSGTHAIALCLYGNLKAGDLLLSVQGTPYDTLEKIIGARENTPGSLTDAGVQYQQIELLPDGHLDWQKIDTALQQQVKMVLVQRSCGYSTRPSLNMAELKKLCHFIKQRTPDTIIFVDNCYGEFVEPTEPTENGADLVAGSLIKNPGGGIAPTGGYVAGKTRLVNNAATRLTAPGLGADLGPSLGWQRLFFQGLYYAPHVVMEALRGSIWGSLLFRELGFKVFPAPEDHRTDIIQAVVLNSPRSLEQFCRNVQLNSPVDSYVTPVPAPMPGYSHPVIMAAGTFIQGASLEFTADAPVREPFVVFFQGGISHTYTKIILLAAAREILEST